MKTPKRGKSYKAVLIDAYGGPLANCKISMGLSQHDTLVFTIKGCRPGSYHRHSVNCKSAHWVEEPVIIRRPARGASL